MANGIRKIAGERDEQAQGVLGHRHGKDAAGIGDEDAGIAELRVHELRHAGRGGMNPFQFFGVGELLCAQRVANEDVRVEKFLRKAVVVRKMHDADGGPVLANCVGEGNGRTPFGEGVPDADGELGVFWSGARHLGFRFKAEVAAGHVGGRGFAEDAEHGGGEVAQGAAGGELEGVVFGDADEGDGIGGVVSVRAAGGGIDHGFGVAVIGGDDPGAAAWLKGLIDAAEARVHGFDGFDGGFEFAGVADHVGVGVIHDDCVEFAFFDGFHDRVGNSFGGHFGLQVVRCHFWRGHEDALFAGERLFDAAVEEISDVRVFFSFGAAEIFVLQLLEDLCEDLLEFFGGYDALEPRPVFVVLGHADEEKIFRTFGVGEFVEVGGFEGVGDLAGAVGAEIVEDDRVVIANQAHGGGGAGAAGDYDGLDEFIGDVLFVALLQRGDGIVGFGFRFAVDEGAVGEFDALPAVVTVHRVIAADEGGDFADAEFAHSLLELADEVAAAVGWRVAAVHETVDEDLFDFPLLGHFKKSEKVVDVRMHAAVAEEADEMQLALAAALHGLLEERNLVELLVGDEEIDTGDVHVYDAAGADVEVADFAVAHLAFGEADGGT